MKDFIVLVDFAGESISLSAKNDVEAVEMAKNIIAEEYSESVANDASFKVDA